MPKRKINVKKHPRKLSSGKVTSVKRHSREIEKVEISKSDKTKIKKGKSKELIKGPEKTDIEKEKEYLEKEKSIYSKMKIQGYDGFKAIDTQRDILIFIRKYERDPSIVNIQKMEKYKGMKGILFPDEKVKLYRGLYMTNDKDNYMYHPLEDINDGVFTSDIESNSWTKDYSTAVRFAHGSKHWMDELKDFKYEYYGVVLEYTPEPEEILVDLSYIEDEYNISESFPEGEVIIFPDKKEFKIIKVYN